MIALNMVSVKSLTFGKNESVSELLPNCGIVDLEILRNDKPKTYCFRYQYDFFNKMFGFQTNTECMCHAY